MSRPWDSEPTPMTDAIIQHERDTIHQCKAWEGGCTKAIATHARDLERKLRHARQLLYQARHGGFATDSSWQDDVDEHLAAAKEEGK